MELYFLDENFAAVSAPADMAVSVVWSLRYHACGDFTVHLPLTDGAWLTGEEGMTPLELLELASSAVYLCDREHCGRIESVICREDTLEIGGRMLECLLYDRVAGRDVTYTGTLAEAVQAALTEWAGDLALVRDLWDAPAESGLNKTGSWIMEAGTRLGTWIHRITSPCGGSYRIRLTEDGTVHFSLTEGTDRSLDSADGVERAIFSEEFGNIASLEAERYREDMVNRVYVEGSDGTTVTVDTAPDTASRRETYKKAADIRPADFDTTEAYLAALTARGETLLAGEQVRLSCVAESDAQPLYGTGYRLGDVCEILSEDLNIRMAVRLTALDIVHEGGMVKLYPGFGDEIVRVRDMRL